MVNRFLNTVALGLLNVADQLPLCDSAWDYAQPLPNFPSGPGTSACQALPTIVALALVDCILLISDLFLTIMAIDWEYRLRRRQSRVGTAAYPAQALPKPGRGWTTGVGELLWIIEAELRK